MFYYNQMMQNMNSFNCSFPFFAHEGSRDLYVMVPTTSPMVYGSLEECFPRVNNWSAEEILPDFRCKVCSATILTYFEFKAHIEGHKNSGAFSNGSHSLEIMPKQTLEKPKDYMAISNLLNNTTDIEVTYYPEFTTNFTTQNETANISFNNKSHSSEILSKHTSHVLPKAGDTNFTKLKNYTPVSIGSAHNIPVPVYTKSNVGIPARSEATSVAVSNFHPSAALPKQMSEQPKNCTSITKSPCDDNKPLSLTYSQAHLETKNSNENVVFNKSNSSTFHPDQAEKKQKAVLPMLKPLSLGYNAYRCSYCLKRFKTRLEITDHLAQHRKVKEIICVMCKATFSGISSLRKHLLMFHRKNKDRRQCPFCTYRCFQSSDLEKHIARRHTRDFKYKCLHCIKGFATPKELNNHVRRKHFEVAAVVQAYYRKL